MHVLVRSVLEGFVATRGSAEAATAASELLTASASAPRSLLLFGPSGVGKTHLLRAIVRGFALRMPGRSIVSTSARDLARDVMDALRAERYRGLELNARAVAVLADRCGGDVGRGLGALARVAFERSLRPATAG